MYLTTRGLVLRDVKYKESDRILTVLTEHEGKITVRARGAKSKTSRYRAAAQHLVFSEMTLFGNRGRWSLNEAETIEQFLGLREDLTALALGSYFAELLEALSDEDNPNIDILRLGLNALYALSNLTVSHEIVKATTELRLMCLAGYEPRLDACFRCGEESAAEWYFDASEAALVCGGCRQYGELEPLPLCEGSLAAMRHITCADMKKIFSFTLQPDALARLAQACERYVIARLERGFGALDYWKRLT